MTSITIRPASPADTEQIVALAGRSWEAAYGEILASQTIDRALSHWYDPSSTREAIEDEASAYFVAGEDGILGYLSGSGEGAVARLGAIYVDPRRLGNGIGTALLEAFEDWCRTRGYETIEFEVLADNENGQSFYRARDYERVETRETELFGEVVTEHVFRGPTGGLDS